MADFLDRLNTKKLGDAPSTDIDNVSKSISIQESSKEDMQEVVLTNQATLRDGQVIPNTGRIIISPSIIEAGFANQQVICAPEKGETLRILGLSLVYDSSPSGSVTSYIYIQDRTMSGGGSSGSDANQYLDSASNASINTPWSGIVEPSIYGMEITYPLQLIMYVNDMKGTSQANAHLSVVSTR